MCFISVKELREKQKDVFKSADTEYLNTIRAIVASKIEEVALKNTTRVTSINIYIDRPKHNRYIDTSFYGSLINELKSLGYSASIRIDNDRNATTDFILSVDWSL